VRGGQILPEDTCSGKGAPQRGRPSELENPAASRDSAQERLRRVGVRLAVDIEGATVHADTARSRCRRRVRWIAFGPPPAARWSTRSARCPLRPPLPGSGFLGCGRRPDDPGHAFDSRPGGLDQRPRSAGSGGAPQPARPGTGRLRPRDRVRGVWDLNPRTVPRRALSRRMHSAAMRTPQSAAVAAPGAILPPRAPASGRLSQPGDRRDHRVDAGGTAQHEQLPRCSHLVR
jgi:hypothetical protein